MDVEKQEAREEGDADGGEAFHGAEDEKGTGAADEQKHATHDAENPAGNENLERQQDQAEGKEEDDEGHKFQFLNFKSQRGEARG